MGSSAQSAHYSTFNQPFREAKDDAGTAAGDQCDEAEGDG